MNRDITCPNCKKRLAVQRKIAGKHVRCPNEGCGFTIAFPEVETHVMQGEPPDTYGLQDTRAEDLAEAERAKADHKSSSRRVRAARSLAARKGRLNMDEEFDTLGLPPEKKSFAWEAHAKIIWGQPRDEVQAWLRVLGIDRATARWIVAIAIRERARAVRFKGILLFVPGILLCIGAGAWFGHMMQVKHGLAHVFEVVDGSTLDDLPFGRDGYTLGQQISWIAIFVFVSGAFLTLRGLFRIIAGARIAGSLAEEPDEFQPSIMGD